jgi:homoserine dehydrogenase
MMFYGRGAGARPTASAVLGDLIDASLNRGQASHRRVPGGDVARIRPIDDLDSAYYLNLEVNDSPGVLSQVAGVFGRHEVSIRSMEQEGLGAEARLVFITHQAKERAIQATIEELRSLEVVTGVRSFMRVIGA